MGIAGGGLSARQFDSLSIVDFGGFGFLSTSNLDASRKNTSDTLDPPNKSRHLFFEDIEIEGQGVSNEAGFYHMKVADIDENGAMVGKERFLTDEDQLLGRGIENLLTSIDHLALQQAKLGAQMKKASIQEDVIQSRKLAVTKDISAMGDADLAKLVTELQSQLTNRDAAQQAFAKIGQQSLFDYIR